MKTYLDCIPCFFRQALETARLAGAGPLIQRKVLMDLAAVLPDFSMKASPPEMARIVRNLVYKYTGRKDAYAALKRKSNELALRVYPRLKDRLKNSEDPLRTAVELAVAGNIIDYGAKNNIDVEAELTRILDNEESSIAVESRDLFDYKGFRECLARACKIVYLADNAGETVFDRALIEQIMEFDHLKEIVYVVKSQPAINDALYEDALTSGIDSIATIVDSGSDAPGTVLSLCSREFKQLFKTADMVISKGQGNFEALSGKAKREVFFLFMVKCPVIARDVGGQIGNIVLYRKAGKK
jgi:uncharacterized protein with ATP-grasp and redox domains